MKLKSAEIMNAGIPRILRSFQTVIMHSSSDQVSLTDALHSLCSVSVDLDASSQEQAMASVRSIIAKLGKTDIVRSIVVSNIIPGTKEDALVIHFQRRKHGGGDVSSVTFTQDGDKAVVTFEDPETLETVLNVNHKIGGILLKVHRCAEKAAPHTDEVFSQVTAKVDPIKLGISPEETKQILDKMKNEVGVSFEHTDRYAMISGSLSQINSCQNLVQKCLGHEENISDRLNKFSFEAVDDKPEQYDLTKTELLSDDSSTVIIAKLVEDNGIEAPCVDDLPGEDAKGERHPSVAKKQTFKVDSLSVSFMRQVFRKQVENITEKCLVGFSKIGGETEVTLQPRPDGDPTRYIDACSEFVTLLESASQGMTTWELDSKWVDSESVFSSLQHLRTKYPVIVDQPQENGPFVVYGDVASVEQVKLLLQEALTQQGNGNTPAGAESNETAESSSVSIETFSFATENGITVSLRYGDITSENVEAIVNPANTYLSHGAGLADFIVQKGGYEIQKESDKLLEKRSYRQFNVGDAVYTKAGNLPCKFVIHAVGPEWKKQPEKKTIDLLQKSCVESLKLASKLGLSSIALPAISSGLFRAPIDVCAVAMLNGLQEYLEYLKKSDVMEKEGPETKQGEERTQKKEEGKKRTSKIKSQTKEESIQVSANEKDKQKPRLNDIRFVLIDADAMDVFEKEFINRFVPGLDHISDDDDESL